MILVLLVVGLALVQGFVLLALVLLCLREGSPVRKCLIRPGDTIHRRDGRYVVDRVVGNVVHGRHRRKVGWPVVDFVMPADDWLDIAVPAPDAEPGGLFGPDLGGSD